MKGRPISYGEDELAWLEANRLLPIADFHAAFVAAFDRTDVTAGNLHALRKRKGWRTGRSGRFEPGAVPVNKGRPMPSRGRSAETQFKQGERRGVAIRLWKPIGTERLSKEGYLERKINDNRPVQSRWRAVHLVRWEAVNGPIPGGHALKCLDGDRLNTDPINWLLVSRALMPRLNGGRNKKHIAFDDAAPELKPTIMAVAQLAHRARQARAKS